MLKGNLFVGLFLIFNLFHGGCYLTIIFLCFESVYDFGILLSISNLVSLSNVWHCAIIHCTGPAIYSEKLNCSAFLSTLLSHLDVKLIFMECIKRKECLQKLILTTIAEGKRSIRKKRVTYLTNCKNRW